MTGGGRVSASDVRVVDVPEHSRFEALVGGRLAGSLVYELGPRRITLVHAEVEDALRGGGIGGELVAEALRDVRRRGLQVVPLCPFVVRWMREHPDA